MRKIYVVGRGFDRYTNWMQGELTNDINKATLIVFGGGEDVHPSIYNEPTGKFTYTNKDRDLDELEIFKKALELNIPCLGICRGSQFLCAANGGRLVQHQENPSYIHKIKTYDNKELEISSTHHQAAFPYNLKEDEYKVLGWTNCISKFHLDGTNNEISDIPFKECEIVYYPKNNCLGIQGHPEMLFDDNKYSETIEYLRNLLDLFLSKKL